MARKNTTAGKGEEIGFEGLLAEAESLAEKMEDGGLTLDESIKAYEKGVENLRRCSELLKTAEEKVKLLLEKDGAFSLRDLDPSGDGDEDTEDEGDEEDGY